MADIHIRRAHSMQLKKARAATEDFAKRLNEKFDLQSEWDGDTLHFERSGVSGALALTKDSVTIDLTLGFLLSAFAGKMEGHIKDNLDQLFGKAGVTDTRTGAKAAPAKASPAKAGGKKVAGKR